MKKIALLAACVGGLFIACNNQPAATNEEAKTENTEAAASSPNNTLTEEEKKNGWQVLFDGTTKTGWHIFNNKSDGSAWTVEDGSLSLDPKEMKDWQTVGGGDIVTEEEYDNFDLKLEWKVADSGNSGIILFIKEEPRYEHTWHTGPEMQVLDNAGHPDAKIIKHRAADLYDLISSSPETVKKAGEWNQVEVTSNNGLLEFYLNGSKVLSTTMWDDNWKKMIKASKFKDMPDFGTYKKGHIGLQDHGNRIWYRNIKIKKLS
jgi:hypothetical protein